MIDASLLRSVAARMQWPAHSVTARDIGGGSINTACCLECRGSRIFCKINSATKFPHLLLLEAGGLQALRSTGAVRVPQVLHHFESGDSQVLLMEWIEQGPVSPAFWKELGASLARLHGNSHTQHGWKENNYMGAVPQSNERMSDWNAFFITQRLQPLIRKCRDAGLLSPAEAQRFEPLYHQLPGIFGEGPAALLHGDLWRGNYLCSQEGKPVLIDPAVYFGHPAVDLGMTTLFGGFDPLFYESYAALRPLPPNHLEQWRVANLYPLLVHLFLFGRSYFRSIQITLQQYQ